MSIVNIQALKQLGNVLWWPGQSAVSGTYDDDGNKLGFMILPDGVTVTPNGTFTTQKMKDGRNIWKFNGSTNYVSLSDNDAWILNPSDHTICFWFNAFSVSSNINIWMQRNGYVSPVDWLALQWIQSTRKLSYVTYISSAYNGNYSYSWTPTINTWYHIAVVRSGLNCIFYINGVMYTPTQVNAFTSSATNISGPIWIGQYNSSAYYNGNIKDLMIFKDRALTQDQIGALYQETFIY